VLFAVYFIARAHFPDAFHEGAQRLSVIVAGTAITLLMITSSYFIACSVNAIRQDRQRAAVIWLVAGLVVALGYPLPRCSKSPGTWRTASTANRAFSSPSITT
jgi:cytochrome c oxidase subunit 3